MLSSVYRMPLSRLAKGTPNADLRTRAGKIGISRRSLFAGMGALIAGAPLAAAAAQSGRVDGTVQLTRYRVDSDRWSGAPTVRIAALADLHICDPYMTLAEVERIVDQTNQLNADLIVLLGDFVGGHEAVAAPIPHHEWGAALGRLKAPLGVLAVQGNHDWDDDTDAQHRASRTGMKPVATRVRRTLENAHIRVLENDAIKLGQGSAAFWVAGLADQLAIPTRGANGTMRRLGLDDMQVTLAQVTDDAPAILLAHEPDVFAGGCDRFALTLSGHTHGGQVRMFGYSPIVPSRYGNRYAYGVINETGRHLVVSGGLGTSSLPVRLGVPPEIVLVELSGRDVQLS